MKYVNTMILACLLLLIACKDTSKTDQSNAQANIPFDYNVTQFADVGILRYKIHGWKNLTLKQKKFVYYLTQAGLSGRDIIWDQNYRHNLEIRKALEHVYVNFKGDKNTTDWRAFDTYLKRVWFANGIHHHYSMEKMKPGFSPNYLEELLNETGASLKEEVFEVLFNDIDTKKVVLDKNADVVLASATNFYAPDITTAEAYAFYKSKTIDLERPVELGLNARLVKNNGKIEEQVYKSGGLYGAAIDQIIKWLTKAKAVAETPQQAKALGLLIAFYKTGDLKVWDDYAVAWTQSTAGAVDWINGFIEVYNDPIGFKGSFESIVQIKDVDLSKKMEVLSTNAQWFEDNAPLMPPHKKPDVIGVTYKSVNVAGEAGDASPGTPIGVNLPNNGWIRDKIGSKSVSLGNIMEAYVLADPSDKLNEFAHDEEEIYMEKTYGVQAARLLTALHEVVGHASGRINPGVGTPKETLGIYKSTIEEGRADLFALYYLLDSKIQELGLCEDFTSIGIAAYDGYIRNGLVTQLSRLEINQDLEEAHMRNRQWVSAWVFEKGQKDNVIEKIITNDKTYYNITDYEGLRKLFGELLRETQRITSEGDFKTAKALVENYGVKVNPKLHNEVLERNFKFKTPAYRGFVNPVIVPKVKNGKILSFHLEQPQTFEEQMLMYSKKYGFLVEF